MNVSIHIYTYPRWFISPLPVYNHILIQSITLRGKCSLVALCVLLIANFAKVLLRTTSGLAYKHNAYAQYIAIDTNDFYS